MCSPYAAGAVHIVSQEVMADLTVTNTFLYQPRDVRGFFNLLSSQMSSLAVSASLDYLSYDFTPIRDYFNTGRVGKPRAYTIFNLMQNILT